MLRRIELEVLATVDRGDTISKLATKLDHSESYLSRAVADPVEKGLLVGTREVFAKSYVLKREYEDEEHPFGWMQDGVFELFDQKGRLNRWRTEEDLVDVTGELP